MSDIFKVTFHDFLDPPWLRMAPLNLGDVPPGLGTPDRYVTVEKSEQPFLLVNIYAFYWPIIPPIKVVWREWLFIGFGEDLHVISLETGQHFSWKVNGYCAKFFPLEDYLLASTADKVFCFDKNARLVWISDDVGLDGVFVEEVAGNVVKGIGEWDPPGGWRPFALDLTTGKIVKENKET